MLPMADVDGTEPGLLRRQRVGLHVPMRRNGCRLSVASSIAQVRDRTKLLLLYGFCHVLIPIKLLIIHMTKPI